MPEYQLRQDPQTGLFYMAEVEDAILVEDVPEEAEEADEPVKRRGRRKRE